jgi:NADPH:quinone reductase-like Zn-dependent oxidoreductase
MKAYELRDSFGIDSLVLVDRPDPQPGAGQIVVRMKAFSLNFRDLLMVKGLYNPKLRLPIIPLSDGAGTVEAVGSGVTRVKVGDRVAGIFMQAWLDGDVTEAAARSALGGAIDGVLAEYVLFNQEGVVHVPENLNDEEAATLPCAAVTAWHALVTEGCLKAGDCVLTQGTGGVSLFAVQFAHVHGARVIITSSSNTKLQHARQLGAADGINYKELPDWDRRARELTGGRGVDHVIELGGASTLGKSLKAVRMGGRISLIGVLGGGQGEVNPMPLLMKNVCVQGIFVGSRAMFETMNRAIAQNRMRPVIDRVFSFDEIREALRYLESGSHFGKICIHA